jgi:hypothetical protein
MLMATETVYRGLAKLVLFAAVASDLLRYFKIWSAPASVLLGFRSAAHERWRHAAFLLLLLPFVHLSWQFAAHRKIQLGSDGICCVFQPKSTPWWDRVNKLGFLLFVTGFFLFGDSHHHGYFVLRVAEVDRSAAVLLRNALAEVPLHGTEPAANAMP